MDTDNIERNLHSTDPLKYQISILFMTTLWSLIYSLV